MPRPHICAAIRLFMLVSVASAGQAAEPEPWSHWPSQAQNEKAEVLLLAQVTEGGNLEVQPASPSVCPGESVFFTGQSVRLVGSGFGAGAVIEIYFGFDGGDLALMQTASADGSGVLDATVMIPVELSTPALGMFKTFGDTGGGGRLGLSALVQVAGMPGSDSDSDLVPDICDNCPATSNAGQEDNDSDGLGNACDPCPNDAGNDRDGDGLCAEVDACPFDANNDADGDGVCGNRDNCPSTSNPNQLDQDFNGIGDACQASPTCSDGVDNDGDTFIDYPSDAGCSDTADTSETSASLPCDDGVDNDTDALVDYRPGGYGDPGCGADTSQPEDPECDDGIDNDGDGNVDWDGRNGLYPADEDCGGVGSAATEMPEPNGFFGLIAGAALLSALRRAKGQGFSPRCRKGDLPLNSIGS